MDTINDTYPRQFSGFSVLPKEIRLLIWEECMLTVPPQVLDLSTIMDEGQSEDGMKFTIEPPLLSRVCQESRIVALSEGRSFLLSHRYLVGHTKATSSVRTWFSGQRDLVEFAAERGYNKKREWVFDDEMRGLLACVQHVMLQPGADADLLAAIARPGACPKLRVINVMLERFEVTDAEVMDPKAVVDFFGDDRLVLLDIEDVLQAQDVAKRFPEWQHSPYWVKNWYEFAEDGPAAMRSTIEQAKDRVTKAWLEARLPRSPTVNELGPIEYDEDLMRSKKTVLDHMPNLRAVRCCDWPYADMDVEEVTWTWRDDTALKSALETFKPSP